MDKQLSLPRRIAVNSLMIFITVVWYVGGFITVMILWPFAALAKRSLRRQFPCLNTMRQAARQ